MTTEYKQPAIRSLWRSPACAAMAVAIGTFVAAPAAGQENGLDRAREDLRVDRRLDALQDPLLRRMATRPPRGWPGPRGAQPFDQEPPAAQRNFTRPENNTGGGQQNP